MDQQNGVPTELSIRHAGWFKIIRRLDHRRSLRGNRREVWDLSLPWYVCSCSVLLAFFPEFSMILTPFFNRLESLRVRYGMETLTPELANKFPLAKSSYDWMRKRERVALPILPPTTLEARRYFFKTVSTFSGAAITSGKTHVDYVAFAQEWNRTADGQTRFYITPDMLLAYAKYWEKVCNMRASEELMNNALSTTKVSAEIFAAENQPFPAWLTATPSEHLPLDGLIPMDIDDTLGSANNPGPPRATHTSPAPLDLHPPPAASATSIPQPLPMPHHPPPESTEPSAKRRREVPAENRIRKTVRKCRRCHRESCPGGSDIRRCPAPCFVPCKVCGRYDGCTGVDNGKKCSFQDTRRKGQ